MGTTEEGAIDPLEDILKIKGKDVILEHKYYYSLFCNVRARHGKIHISKNYIYLLFFQSDDLFEGCISS